MKLSSSLVMLLAASAASAASAANDVEPTVPAVRMGPVPSAAGGGEPHSRGALDELLVFDSYTGAGGYVSLASAPRTFMGMALDLETDVGPDPQISRMVVYMAYNGAAPQSFAALTSIR